MNNFNGIGTNFVGVKSLYGAKRPNIETEQKTTELVPQNEIEKTNQRKSPNEILNSMHNFGLQNIVKPKISAAKNDPQMTQRIGDFMANFEKEVEKGLKILAKDFPSMDETKASEIAAKAALKASDFE